MKKTFVFLLHVGFWACYFLLVFIALALYYRSNHDISRVMNALNTIFLFAFIPSVGSFYSYYFLLFAKYLQKKKIFQSIFIGILISLVVAILAYILLRFFIESGRILDMDEGGKNGRSTAPQTILVMTIIGLLSGNLNLSSEKSDISDFIYDKKGNLIRHTQKDEYNTTIEKVYYYRGDTVFEDCRDKNAPFERRINIYTINKYGKIITSYTWGEESQFFDIYDRDKKMATVNSRYPKLYNTLFCYSTDGRLLTYEYDHDRKLYEFIYSTDNKLVKIEHIQGQRVVERSEYSYGENGLPVKITRWEGIYYYYDFNNKNYYTLEYEFY